MRAIPFTGIFSTIALAAALSGCATTPNIQKSELMPREAALKIVAAHVGDSWAKNPYVFNAPLCGGDTNPITYSQIDSAKVDLDGLHLHAEGDFLDCDEGGIIIFRNLRGEAADEFATALHSLGAQI